MKYIPLLRKKLKSDEIIELLETNDMEVVYEFDRTHENIPDEYRAKSKDLGLELLFDEDQIIKTVFINLTEVDGFTPADLKDSDVTRFDSKKSASDYARKTGIVISEGRAHYLGKEIDWIRFEHEGYTIHYEYRNGSLALVTLTTA
jgi:hypothetical protein